MTEKEGKRCFHFLECLSLTSTCLSTSLLLSLTSRPLPQPPPQIDLVTADQEAREKMWAAADGSREIPQLHVDGKVRIDILFFRVSFLLLLSLALMNG